MSVSAYVHTVAWLKTLKIVFYGAHESNCVSASVCSQTCVSALVCVRVRLQGHLGPWFPAQDEWALLYHCLGQQRSRLRLPMFRGGKEVVGGGHVGVVFSTPSRGQGSSPSASILLLRLTGLWIQD